MDNKKLILSKLLQSNCKNVCTNKLEIEVWDMVNKVVKIKYKKEKKEKNR